MDTDRDIVLFLGAGFSADADLPVMSKFGEAAKRDHFRLKDYVDPKSPQHRLMAPDFDRAARTYEAFRDLCLERHALLPKNADNIEELMCIAESLRAGGLPSLELESVERDCTEVVDQIRFWIWKVYQQIPFFNSERNPKPTTYKRFFEPLRDANLNDQVTVVTTNYDIIFEQQAREHGLCARYPMDFREANVGSGPDRFIAPVPGFDRSIPVCKLHGSVNYFTNPEDETDLFVSGNLSDGKPIMLDRGVRAGMPAVGAVDSLAALRKKYEKPLMPAIIPPTYAKLDPKPWLESIWKAALHSLRYARLIVFIGYSMPESDGFMRALVAGSVATRARNARLQIRVIDECEKVHQRYRRFFGDTVVETPRMYLGEATKKLLPEILTDAAKKGA